MIVLLKYKGTTQQASCAKLLGKSVERVRECEAAGRAGVGLARMEDISNPISFERNPSSPICREQEVQLINYLPVSRTVYL